MRACVREWERVRDKSHLNDHRIACKHCWYDGVDGGEEGVVPGGDDEDHPNRLWRGGGERA